MLRRMSLFVLAATAIALPGTALAQPNPTKPTAPPAVTTRLPAGTPGLIMINTSLTAWGELNRFNPYADKPLALPFPVGSFALGDFDYARDIAPWLGDRVAIALLPITSATDTLNSNLVALIPTTDAAKSNATLEKIKAFAKPTTERTYNGVTIWEWVAPKSPDTPNCGEIPTPTAPAAGPTKAPAAAPKPSQPLKLNNTNAARAPEPSLLRAFMGATTACSPAAKTPSETPSETPSDAPSDAPTETEPTGGMMPPVGPQRFALAMLPDQIALAQEPAALERLIDAQASGAPLAQSPNFQRTLADAQFPSSLLMNYGEYGSLLKLINQTIQLPTDPTKPDSPKKPLFAPSTIDRITRYYSTFDSLVWVQPNGLRSEANAYFTSPQPAKATPNLPNANQILTRLPAATYFAGSSRNLPQQWQEILEFSAGDQEFEKIMKQARDELRKATGLDLEKDLLNWMDGEYALFFYPTQEGLFNYIGPKLNLGVGLIVQTSDRPRAEATLKKLGEFLKTSTAKTSSPATIANRVVKGQPTTSWEVKDQQRGVLSLASYSWLSDDTVLITTGVGAAQGLIPKPYLPLHLNPTFKTATDDLIKPNDGFSYVNMGATLAFVYSLVREWGGAEMLNSEYGQITQTVLGSIRSLSATQTTTPEKIHAETLWVLGTYNNSANK